MNKEIVDLLLEIKKKILENSDISWTKYETVDLLRAHIDFYISKLQQGDDDIIDEIKIDFAPTSTFQELSIQNGWSDDYIKLANKFDKVYEAKNKS